MFFTRAGLEQATRAVVADRRAARLGAAGVRTLADLGCGLGADALAFARAGLRVYGGGGRPGDRRDGRRQRRGALGLADSSRCDCGDATAFDLPVWTRSSATRPGARAGTGRRIFDPTAYSPPWAFVHGLAERVPRTVVKVAPGLDHALIPPGAEAEWVSVDGDLVEAALWCGPLADVPPPRHRAARRRARTC